tara:strand:+ start:53921 stop:54106 length:186 start_codon:yes stop_codon:yes gene_type:complete
MVIADSNGRVVFLLAVNNFVITHQLKNSICFYYVVTRILGVVFQIIGMWHLQLNFVREKKV